MASYSKPLTSLPRKTEVVIVGGSSGATLARSLSRTHRQFDPAKHNLTLISQLPYHVWMISAVRMVTTEDQNIESTQTGGLLTFDKLFEPGNAGRFVQGKATRILEDRVELADGKTVPYDYLVLATGSKWSGPMDFDYTSDAQVQYHIRSWRKKIASAGRIVVVGGGAVGLEIVGEIRHYHPHATVTVVHAAPKLLNSTYPDRFRNAAAARMAALGVRVVLGERVLNLPPQGLASEEDSKGKAVQVQTDGGLTLDADLVIPALGARPNTSIIADFRGGSALTSSGHVRVTPSMNIKFTSDSGNDTIAENMFAMGDIIDWPEQHMAAKASLHAGVVSANILAALERDEAREEGRVVDTKKKEKEYKGFPEAILVTFGPNGGILFIPFLWGIILGDWVARFLKATTLMVPRARKAMGLAA